MDAKWNFYEQQPTDTIHNPISGEFFSTEAVGEATEALVREGIQNTLDARCRNPDGSRTPARVRIFLSEEAMALSPIRSRHWFSTLWPHILAQGNRLRNVPVLESPCNFLSFEDFGTTGLNGDPGEHSARENLTNHFLNFFRAEGHSDKGGDDRGSWGVGKMVFPRSSRINAFFGLTVRSSDSRRLLFGRSILKYHRINQKAYKSEGYFGLCQDNGFMLPSDDTNLLTEFRTDFSIKRQNEQGLSIVVPWCEISGEDGVTRDKVISAVLRGFFYPILMGHLSVAVATPRGEIMLDARSIMDQVASIGDSLSLELLPLLELAEWARTRLDTEFQSLRLQPPNQSQKWSQEIVPDILIKHIRQSLAQRQRIAVRVPMHIWPKAGAPQPTFFHVFLEHSEEDREKPVVIRDELIIPRAGKHSVSQVRAIIIVEDRPIATLLRDAEKPAHDEWSTKTANFKGKYQFGPGAISFVQHSVQELLRIVNQTEQQPDPSITIDFFSIPTERDEQDVAPKRRNKPLSIDGDGPTAPIPPPPPPRPRRFRIEKMRGGFSIKPGDPNAQLPKYIEIRVAYDIRTGNPLRKYFPTDFDLSRAPIHCQSQSNAIDVREAEGNRLLAEIHRPEFQLEVTGFDTDRELYVKAEGKEAVNDQEN